MLYRAKIDGDRSYIRHTYGVKANEPLEYNNIHKLAEMIAYLYHRDCIILYIKEDGCNRFRKVGTAEQKEFDEIMSSEFRYDEMRRH